MQMMIQNVSVIFAASLICDFCPSDRSFAYSFLQIPSHDGHPYCSAIHFPLSGRVRDLHPLEHAHGAQTKIRRQTSPPYNSFYLIYMVFFPNILRYSCAACSEISSFTCNLFKISSSGNPRSLQVSIIPPQKGSNLCLRTE